MATKVFVNHPRSLSVEKSAELQKHVADKLGMSVDDVIVLQDTTVTVVEVPEPKKAPVAKSSWDKA